MKPKREERRNGGAKKAKILVVGASNFGGQAALTQRLSTKTMPLEDGADGSRSLGNDQESVQDLAGVRGGLCSVVERVYMPLVSASA